MACANHAIFCDMLHSMESRIASLHKAIQEVDTWLEGSSCEIHDSSQ